VSAREETPSGHGFPRGGVFNASPDAVVVIAVDGFVVDWNPRAEELFGYRRSDAVGRELGDLIVPEKFRAAHRQALGRWRSDDAGAGKLLGQRLHLTGQRADRTTFPVELTLSRLGEIDPPMFAGFIRELAPGDEPRAGADAASESAASGRPTDAR
jgi:PAS domain S-box-containing protein